MRIDPPELVEARAEREPSEARERRVAVEGSNEVGGELLAKTSRPANAPAMPTLPMRLKSTRGTFANAAFGRTSIKRHKAKRWGHEENEKKEIVDIDRWTEAIESQPKAG